MWLLASVRIASACLTWARRATNATGAALGSPGIADGMPTRTTSFAPVKICAMYPLIRSSLSSVGVVVSPML
jgi:hypothetical protein